MLRDARELQLAEPRLAVRSIHIGNHIFSNLPLSVSSVSSSDAAATDPERQLLITGDKMRGDGGESGDGSGGSGGDGGGGESTFIRAVDRVPRVMLAISATVCTLFLVVTIVSTIVLVRRIDQSVSNVDNAVSFHESTTKMIKNVDTILGTSAQIADTVQKLGIKGLDASMFSKPFLTRILNTTTNLLDDFHRVAEHPSISIGGRM